MPDTHSHPAVYRLRRVLDSDATRHEVADAFSEAEQSGEVLPALLRYRVEERIGAERMLERRRLLFVVGVAITVFGTIVGGFALTSLDRSRTLDQSESAFQELVDNEQWEEADLFLRQLDEASRFAPAFVKGRQLVDESIRGEQDRKQAFVQLQTQLDSADPATWDLTDAERLRSMARTETEIAEATRLFAIAEEQRLKRAAQRTDKQTNEFESLQGDVETFLAATLEEDERLSRQAELRRKLGEFIAANNLSNPELTETARQSVALLSREADAQAERRSRETILNAVTEAVGDADRFVSELGALVEDDPKDFLSVESSQMIEKRGIIDATSAWKKVLEHPAFQQPGEANAETADEWLRLVAEARELSASHRFAADPSSWEQHYVAITKRKELIDRLQSAMKSPLTQRMFVYTDKTGKRYYSRKPVQSDSKTPHVVPIIENLTLRESDKNFGLRFSTDVAPNVQAAGHSRFMVAAKRQIETVQVVDFTPALFRLINDLRTYRSQPEFDPIYRLNWMRDLLEIASAGSVPIRRAFGDWERSIKQAPIDWTANWISPDSDTGDFEANRLLSRQIIDDVDSGWDGKVADMLAEFKRFRKPRKLPPRWIGWVTRDQDNHFAVLAEEATGDPTYVVVPDGRGGQAKFVEIDLLDTSQPITDPVAQVGGAMIYAIPERTVAERNP